MAWDVVIVGAGPAGTSAAIAIKNKNPNMNVVIIDAINPSITNKVGEALLTGTVYALEKLGVIEACLNQGFQTKIGAAYRWGMSLDPWYVKYTELSNYPKKLIANGHRMSFHVRRDKFDSMLLECAEKLGVVYIQNELSSIRKRGETLLSCQLKNGETILSKYWIDASGQAAVIAQEFSSRHKIYKNRVALRGYVKINWELVGKFYPNTTNIIHNKYGWMWLIHLGDLTSFGFVTTKEIRTKISTKNIYQYIPELKDIFMLGHEFRLYDYLGNDIDDFIYQKEWSYYSEKMDGKNWSSVGDASAFLDPILSQGVTLAMSYGILRGEAAIEAIMGNTDIQKEITHQYTEEIKVLKHVIAEWYKENNTLSDWFLNTQQVVKNIHGFDMNKNDSFRWLTNLDYKLEEFFPYPKTDISIYQKNLAHTEHAPKV
ncbi:MULTISPECIES: NAD(P)/FAD-dependent oxidoreductase [Cysteiniphilum]|uniref:Uncharacterized protein n=1 Tax=Cysteiniphilum litorale TaxID=2056700 RepID=A0A8J2Z340_9GAMM|nr:MULTISPECIES: NAD(P)/FAD-dependent oxidoreductase [Cysteiniphilum]GGF91954.1 hypothetical protein GCM10010995_06370 [Cysteiniphilum litorale]